MLETIVTGVVGGLLLLMMGWLKSDITKLSERVDARFERVDARFERVDARFERVDARFDSTNERIDTLSDRMAELLQITARTEGKLDEHLRQHH
jgi:predicted  nucleic acid-binding Zn-ribbon protein